MAIVVVDASVLIAFFDARDPHHEAAVGIVRRHQDDTLVLPVSAYEPLTRDLARQAALLRARHRALRLPDAFVLATADAVNASAVLTADRAWTKVSPRVRVI